MVQQEAVNTDRPTDVRRKYSAPPRFVAKRTNARADRLQHLDRRMRSRIGTFECWLQGEPYKDFRVIEEIPPDELDTYLAKFFSTIKTVSGERYSLNSICSLRTCLERHLKNQGYPHSIILSPLFSKSRFVWKQVFPTYKNPAATTPRGTPGGPKQ